MWAPAWRCQVEPLEVRSVQRTSIPFGILLLHPSVMTLQMFPFAHTSDIPLSILLQRARVTGLEKLHHTRWLARRTVLGCAHA